MKIRKAEVAGLFYPKIDKDLFELVNNFKMQFQNESGYYSRALIVPHAGYNFSGKVAAKAYHYLDKNVQNILIFAPAHRMFVDGMVTSSHDVWQTPLGNLNVNNSIKEDLINNFDVKLSNQPFEKEHSIEVQLPFIQTFIGNKVNIIPILFGKESYINILAIIEEYIKNPKNAIIISSDLSHFKTLKEATLIDSLFADCIESGECEDLVSEQACGLTAIQALCEFAQSGGHSLIRASLTSSYDANGEENKVVGYGAWFLYGGTKNYYIKKYLSPLVRNIVFDSIEACLNKKNIKFDNIPEVFKQKGASFVTLNIEDNLRGCIGSILATRPLIEDLVSNAKNSAFADPRFYPVQKEELEAISASVSLISSPTEITFKNEEDLLSKITPDKDGLILKEDNHQATYLPSVWEQLPNKKLFLNSLKRKAGLSENYFSNKMKIFKYSAEYIK